MHRSCKAGRYCEVYCLLRQRQIGSQFFRDVENDNGNLKITKKDRLKITNYGEKTKSIWLSFHFVYT